MHVEYCKNDVLNTIGSLLKRTIKFDGSTLSAAREGCHCQRDQSSKVSDPLVDRFRPWMHAQKYTLVQKGQEERFSRKEFTPDPIFFCYWFLFCDLGRITVKDDSKRANQVRKSSKGVVLGTKISDSLHNHHMVESHPTTQVPLTYVIVGLWDVCPYKARSPLVK